MSSQLFGGVHTQNFKHFDLSTLVVKSEVLKKNPLKDSTTRFNPILIPKNNSGKLPIVFVLSGFAGHPAKYMSPRFHEDNFIQELDQLIAANKAPLAYYVFVDAYTFWGGSQFINSNGMGRYEDYIVKELLEQVVAYFQIDSKKVCAFGGSSGGYGALSLARSYPDLFNYIGAIAPDSFFEASLLPEIRENLIKLEQNGGLESVQKKFKEDQFVKKRDSFGIANIIAMGLCYATTKDEPFKIKWPIDLRTGELIEKNWKLWLKHDPIEFLKNAPLNKSQKFYLDVGIYDQFQLQYGTRQIADILKSKKVEVRSGEFVGNRFDISSRRSDFFAWLNKVWGH